MSKEIKFDGQVAFVTGGAAGLGKAYSLMLAERRAFVVVNGNYRPDGHGPEDNVVNEIRARGGTAIGVNGSVTDEASVQRMIATAVEQFGRLDIVINNAGTGDLSLKIEDAPEERLEQQFDVHLRGPMRVVRAAWPHLSKSGHGRILNTGSAAAFGYMDPSGSCEGAYSTAKSAMFAVTRQMAGAGAQHGIKANLVMPWAYSQMAERNFGGTDFGQWMESKLPSSRVAAAIVYLVHPDCPCSGQFFSAGGGRMTRVLFVSPKGYYNADITPEAVRDNWESIYGDGSSLDFGEDMLELTGQAREFQEIQNLVG